VNVLYVADTFLPKRDGVVRYMLETYSRFKDVNVSFLVPDFEGARAEAKRRNINASFCPVMRFKIADYPPTNPKSEIISQALKDVDVVCIHSIAPLGAATLLMAKKTKKKIVEIIHSIDWQLLAYGTKFPEKAMPVVKSAAKYLYNKSDILIVANKLIKDILKSNGVKKQIKIIPLGVDKRRFKKDLHKRVLMRRKLGLKDNFVITYLGRLSKEKNIEMLIKAFNLVKRKIPNAKLLLIGGGALENFVARQKNKDIILTGFVNNPEDYLQATDLFVLPSKTETTALALMEAMAIGLPVIASSVGAIPSYVKSGYNGILISKNSLSVQMISNAIEIIYSSPLLRIQLGQNAEKTIRDFSWERTASELERVFKAM